MFRMFKLKFYKIMKLLRILKWLLLPITIIVFLMFVEAATDAYGISSSEEGIMYFAWILVAANAALFIYDKKWQKLIDRWS